jgi:short-subunit dehydrogenase
MIRRNRGALIFNASLAALRPSPGSGLYPPTKAFQAIFARSLALELAGTGIRVQALCPGYTRTEFHDHPAFDGLKAFLPKAAWGTSRDVVRASLRAAAKGRTVVIPGALNRLTAKIVPESVLLRSYMKNRWDRVRCHESPQKMG